MDHTLEQLSTYACELTYEDVPAEVVHQVKRTLIDTLQQCRTALDGLWSLERLPNPPALFDALATTH